MSTAPRLDDAALDRLFREARSYQGFRTEPLPHDIVRQIYDLARWGPTATNGNPGRFVFVRSAEAKERLRPHLMPLNVDKTMLAPCCVIVAYDLHFPEKFGELFPGRDLSGVFADQKLLVDTAFRNSSLQGAYMMLAARSLGLDCGPMSGFNAQSLDQEFFPDGRWKSNFLCNIGYGDPEKLWPRLPRLKFEDACRDL